MPDWSNQITIALSADEWLRLLMNPKIFKPNDLDMITFVYYRPDHCSTATEIGYFMAGISRKDKLQDNRIVANRITSQNRSIAKRIYYRYNIEPPKNSNGGYRYWNLLFDGDTNRYPDTDGKWIWIMRPNLVKAISEALKFSNDADEIHSSTNVATDEHFKRLYTEGNPITVQSIRYERNPLVKRKCVEAKGCFCHVCHFDFEAVYGSAGRGKIHVHHIIPLSTRPRKRKTDFLSDLIPVCPNCHYIIHSKNPPYTPEEVRKMLSACKNRQT